MQARLQKPSVYIGISPTKKSLRIGELRTFLYIYAFSRHNSIPVYIRIDDTNPNSQNNNFTHDILKEMVQMGFDFSTEELSYWNNDLLYQSKNINIYKYFLDKLNKIGVLSELDELVSLNITKAISLIDSKKNISGKDILRRSIKFDMRNTGYEFIPLYIKKEDRFLFHLPCVVDEYLMNTFISIRGEDKLCLMLIHDILRALLQFPIINYLHLPLLLMPDSNKRIRGEKYSWTNLRNDFTSEKILSYLLKSGYRYIKNECDTLKIFTEKFDVNNIKKQSTRLTLN